MAQLVGDRPRATLTRAYGGSFGVELSKLASGTDDMNAVAEGPLAAGREAFSARKWERAFELLRAADADHALAPADLERLSDAARWTRRYDQMLELLERAELDWR